MKRKPLSSTNVPVGVRLFTPKSLQSAGWPADNQDGTAMFLHVSS